MLSKKWECKNCGMVRILENANKKPNVCFKCHTNEFNKYD